MKKRLLRRWETTEEAAKSKEAEVRDGGFCWIVFVQTPAKRRKVQKAPERAEQEAADILASMDNKGVRNEVNIRHFFEQLATSVNAEDYSLPAGQWPQFKDSPFRLLEPAEGDGDQEAQGGSQAQADVGSVVFLDPTKKGTTATKGEGRAHSAEGGKRAGWRDKRRDERGASQWESASDGPAGVQKVP